MATITLTLTYSPDRVGPSEKTTIEKIVRRRAQEAGHTVKQIVWEKKP